MSSPATRHQSPVTPSSDDEVLVRVEGVSKKFCRSLKKSLWYGVCDIAGELLPGRKRRETRDEGRELPDRSAQDISRSPLDAGLSTSSASALDSSCSASALDSGPSTLDSSSGLRAGEFFAVKDVSFELRRGELRTLGRSEKEISKKCLGATKVPDSGRRRHQCLGLIGHNGAGNQAAGLLLVESYGSERQSLGRLPKVARRVRRRGKARINMTLLKMLNGLIKPDRGTITMRGRVGALIALGAGFNPILTGRENIFLNGAILGMRKAEIREFIDMPVQSYSSGMSVRLGFAVATALAFGFLVVNEVVLA